MKKILIKGFGSIGKKHFNAAIQNNFIVDIFSQHTSEVPDSNKVIRDSNEIDCTYDLTIICSNTCDHINDILKFSKVSSILLVEKPLTSTKICEEQLHVIRELNSNVYVGYNLRFLGIVRFLRDYFRGKRILSLYNRFWDDCRKWYHPRDVKDLYVADVNKGGGALLTNYHEVDYLKFITQSELRNIEVSRKYNSVTNYKVDERAFLRGTLDNSTEFISDLNIFSPMRLRDGNALLDEEYVWWNIDLGTVSSSVYGIIYEEPTNYQNSYKKQLAEIFEENNYCGSSFESNCNDAKLIFEK